MKFSTIPLAVPNLTGNEARYLQECIKTNYVSSVGPFVNRFESMVAAACGTRGAVATASGTAALHLALVALGIKAGDLVVMPALTFIAPANAVSYTGAMPAFLDLNADSLTLDPESVRRFLETDCELVGSRLVHRASGRNVAAILAVHTLGHPADMRVLCQVAEEFSLPIVGDAAAALGATCHGEKVTAMGMVSALSFNGNKTVTSGGGGAVVSNDDGRLALIRHISSTARSSADYDHDQVGFNYRMTNLQAAVGCAQMERLDEFLVIKRRIAETYERAFENFSEVKRLPKAPWAESAYWFSGLILDRACRISAGDMVDALVARGIGARRFWKPLHLQAPYSTAPRAALPVSEEFWDRIVTLPCSTGLTSEDQKLVIEAVGEMLEFSPQRAR